ncbi:MAG: efflux RND transporter periplasmic adaptor subunit [Planctomycetales bacterium]|nr:efflux RND transporter periplasmic adaptor subunit [Planctomycetales bacterium]MBN8627006.1 efflux RND transporter periplasmic adaptor subunit [Planctomycetota bacterium]
MSQSIVGAREAPRAPVATMPRRSSWKRLWDAARRAGLVIFIMAVLGGAGYWGHVTDWRIPKFSELWGTSAAPGPRWCEEHGVPEADCIECNPARFPPDKDFGWCPVHGVAQCPFEHPEIVQTKEPTSPTTADRARAERALNLLPRGENNSGCQLHLRRIQFATHEAAESAGVDVAVVGRGPVVEAIVSNGEVTYDETRLAHLSSRVPGSVWSVRKQVGEKVLKGEVLALVDSADVGRAKAEFLQALTHERLNSTNLKRMTPLAEQGAVPERQLREAAAAHHEAEIRLSSARQALVNLGFVVPADSYGEANIDDVSREIQFLGIPVELSSTWDRATSTSNLFPLRASLDGVVIERSVVEGEVIDTARSLFTIGDVDRMWLMLNVRQDEVRYVHIDLPVRFRPSDRSREDPITGKVSWISTAADERTRTVRVRVDLPNAGGALRANTFGTGQIVLREETETVLVPSEAVHWDGFCHVVFVRDRNYFAEGSPKFYHVRPVRLGVQRDGRSEILVGAVPGEVIAAKGSTVLAAQLLRSNLGAGCDCAH